MPVNRNRRMADKELIAARAGRGGGSILAGLDFPDPARLLRSAPTGHGAGRSPRSGRPAIPGTGWDRRAAVKRGPFKDEARPMTTRTSASPPHTEFFPPPMPPRTPPRWLVRFREDVTHVPRFWPVVQNMVVQELRVRYHRSVLGFFWTLLNPILMMATFTVVFSQLIPRESGPLDYAVYLFAGLLPWTFLAGTLNECAFCIIQNEGLIRKIFLPKLIFPLARTLLNLTTLVLSMGALFLLLLPLGARFHWSLMLLPVAMGLTAAFALGLGLMVAIMNTFYRDCGHLVGVFLQAWYFATPIMWKLTDIRSPKVQRLFMMNPAYPFIRFFQVIIHDGQCPSLTLFLVAAGIATVSLGAGYAAFKSHEDKLVFRL